MRNRKCGVASVVLALFVLGACSSDLRDAAPKVEGVKVQDVVQARDTLTVMLSNTMVVTAKDGTVQNWMFNKDGTLDSLENVTGTWEFDGKTLCTLYGERTKPGCWLLPRGKGVGDSWELVVGSGKVLQITIVEGR